ncbi:serine hydrolase domain-containing protein [Ilumatobacter nonamiensis]|uniref:serine hydrolase domain-containing protein n=1 Tax=Ilumatobacter nonamiensis TaxID=467093 RepID=UPI000347D1EC|nr:serine hydrolase domain-containing protein [Ilumatobacter nonamiensis]
MRIRRGALRHRGRAIVAIAVAGLLVAGCGTRESDASVPGAQIASRNDGTEPADTSPEVTPAGGSQNVPSDEADTERDDDDDDADATSTTTSTTTTTTSTTTTTGTTLPPAVDAPRPIRSFPATTAAFDRLAGANAAASITVVRGGEPVVAAASGVTVDGTAATSDSPMVVASVSKIVVALGIARLIDQELVDADEPYPWAAVGLEPDAGWADVTVRELLDHTGGVPKVQEAWFTGDGTCRDFVPALLTSPPTGDRGRWVYSNGNYCLLGLLIEQRTGLPLDEGLQELVFDPIDLDGFHQTLDGLLPGDVPHEEGTDRLSRLGGAGTLVASTDDLAMAMARMTPMDRWVLRAPGVFTDQYGFGHTGTITGAKACVWVLEDGATVVAATISGNSVGSGGDICDIVVPAVASDLGLGSAKPDRTP